MSKKQSVPLWKWLLQILWLPMLVIFAASLFSWSGRREWRQTKTELLARGEKLSIWDFVPPPVPDDQNFYADPAWSAFTVINPTAKPSSGVQIFKQQMSILSPPLTNKEIEMLKMRFPGIVCFPNTERSSVAKQIYLRLSTARSEEAKSSAATALLDLLSPSASILNQISELAKRPVTRFPLQYEKGLLVPNDHSLYLAQCAQILGLRAKASLAMGNAAAAFQDVMLKLRLPYADKTEPLLIPQLGRVSIIKAALAAIDAGIKGHNWSAEQLAAFQGDLSTFQFTKDLAFALRGQRGMYNETFGNSQFNFMRLAPDTQVALSERMAFWIYFAVFFPADQAHYNRVLQREIDNLEQASEQGFLKDDRQYEAELTRKTDDCFYTFAHVCSIISFSGTESVQKNAARIQDQIIQTRIACALERYWLRNGSYPESLANLVPDFLTAIPNDLLTGHPMIYRRTTPGAFQLYAVGWDRVDHGGTPATQENPAGDWVWTEGHW